MLPSAVLYAWISLSLLSVPMSLALPPALCLSLSPSPPVSRPLCPWGPSPFILTPKAITISVVTAGHVTCTCSSGWSPHAGAIWPHTYTHTHTSPLGCLLPSLPPSVFMASLLSIPSSPPRLCPSLLLLLQLSSPTVYFSCSKML